MREAMLKRLKELRATRRAWKGLPGGTYWRRMCLKEIRQLKHLLYEVHR